MSSTIIPKEGILQYFFLQNYIGNFLNKLIPKLSLVSDLSNYFSQLFLKSIPINWQKLLFTFGLFGIIYSSIQMIKKISLWSSVFIQHRINENKVKSQIIKQKYGDCWVAITGFTQGIGWSFTQLLLKLNMKLILIGRNKDKIIKKVNLLKQKYPSAQLQIIIGDLSKIQDIKQICQQLKKLSQSIDIGILINNAGVTNIGQFIEGNPKQIIDISQTNFRSVVQINRTMISIFRKRNERSGLINISSCTGKFISHYLLSYSASKRMINIYTNYLQKQNQDKIDILLAMPFGVTTPMMKMKKQFFMITPDNCAKSIISDLLSKTIITHGGLKHKFLGLMFDNITEKQAADRFAVTWKKQF